MEKTWLSVCRSRAIASRHTRLQRINPDPLFIGGIIFPNDPETGPHHDAVRGNVFRNDGSCTDDAVVSDGDTREYYGIHADKNIIANGRNHGTALTGIQPSRSHVV
jgi:hypothetical protein